MNDPTPIPPEKWIPEMPHDSSEYLRRRRGPWPTQPSPGLADDVELSETDTASEADGESVDDQ